MAVSAALLAHLHKMNTDPAILARRRSTRDWMSPEDRAEVERRIRSGEPYKIIAADFLITRGWVSDIARKIGVRRYRNV